MTSRRTALPWIALLGLSGLAACEWGGGPGPGPSGRLADGSVVDMKKPDSMTIDAKLADAAIDMPPPPPQQHLLLTELALVPDGAELIEIYNPTTNTIDLKDYYLSNHGTYFKLPVNGQTLPLAHFIVRFPQTANIAAGGVIVVATQGAVPFNSFYGVNPTYSITDGTMVAVDVQGTPRLTDGGASVILFKWDGASGLVTDVDIMVAGAPSMTNVLINKSGVMQNGATYATDAMTIPAQPAAPGIDQSTKRTKVETGRETSTNGNGVGGHDETSEATDMTWDTSFGAPTPGVVPTLQ